ncbi:MAG: hypothetical protein Q7R47_04475 [Candidatus Diapherotrites archaeon]|nr:hypothetical protein [Candidatus Diapherotrites archaeon]
MRRVATTAKGSRRNPVRPGRTWYAELDRLVPKTSKQRRWFAAQTIQWLTRYNLNAVQRKQILQFITEFYPQKGRMPNAWEIRNQFKSMELDSIPVLVSPVRGVYGGENARLDPPEDFRTYPERAARQGRIDKKLEEQYARVLGHHIATLKYNWKTWAQQYTAQHGKYPSNEEITAFADTLVSYLATTQKPDQKGFNAYLTKRTE